MNLTKSQKERKRIDSLKKKIREWDKLAEDNEGNKNNLSTTQRQDWVQELIEITE